MSATATPEAVKPEAVGDNWRTPQSVLLPVRSFSAAVGFDGVIRLDPCSGPGSIVKADHEIALPDDGLRASWGMYGSGVVFVNPPYSAPGPWVEKCETERNHRQHVIALLPVATETKWWRWGDAICFWRGRVKFLAPDGSIHFPARGPSALVYWGCRPSAFEGAFEQVGKVVRP